MANFVDFLTQCTDLVRNAQTNLKNYYNFQKKVVLFFKTPPPAWEFRFGTTNTPIRVIFGKHIFSKM